MVWGSFIVWNVYGKPGDSILTYHHVKIQSGKNQVVDKNLLTKVSERLLNELVYGIENSRSGLREFHLALGLGRPGSRLESVNKSANIRILTAYSRLYKIKEAGKIRYYLGPGIMLAYSVCFFADWDESHLCWGNHLLVGPKSYASYLLGKNHQWNTALSIPVFSLFSRPDLYRLFKIHEVSAGGISGNIHSNILPGTWNQVFNLRFNTEYR